MGQCPGHKGSGPVGSQERSSPASTDIDRRNDGEKREDNTAVTNTVRDHDE